MIRSLCYLTLVTTAAACGSGRISPSPAAEPAGEPSAAPVAAPSPASDAAPAVAPAGAPSVAPYTPYDAGSCAPDPPDRPVEHQRDLQPARQVIRDDSTYARFWAALGVGERPAVDFSRDSSSPSRPAGSRRAATPSPSIGWPGQGPDWRWTWSKPSPGPGCMVTQQLTQPVDVVVVAAADAPTWSFSDQTRSQACQ